MNHTPSCESYVRGERRELPEGPRRESSKKGPRLQGVIRRARDRIPWILRSRHNRVSARMPTVAWSVMHNGHFIRLDQGAVLLCMSSRARSWSDDDDLSRRSRSWKKFARLAAERAELPFPRRRVSADVQQWSSRVICGKQIERSDEFHSIGQVESSSCMRVYNGGREGRSNPTKTMDFLTERVILY